MLKKAECKTMTSNNHHDVCRLFQAFQISSSNDFVLISDRLIIALFRRSYLPSTFHLDNTFIFPGISSSSNRPISPSLLHSFPCHREPHPSLDYSLDVLTIDRGSWIQSATLSQSNDIHWTNCSFISECVYNQVLWSNDSIPAGLTAQGEHDLYNLFPSKFIIFHNFCPSVTNNCYGVNKSSVSILLTFHSIVIYFWSAVIVDIKPNRGRIHPADEYTRRRMNTVTGSRAAGRTLRSFSIIKPDDVTAMLDHRLLDHWPPGRSRLSALFQLFSNRCPYFRLISADAARLPVRFDIAADMFIQKCCRAVTATRRTASPHTTKQGTIIARIYQCFRVWQRSFNSIPRWRDGIWKRLQA